MIDRGTLAIATVQRRVVIVQAIKPHRYNDRWLDVLIYQPFGERLFITPPAPQPPSTRIASKDLLFVLSASEYPNFADPEMLELPQNVYDEYMELTTLNRRRMDALWTEMNRAGRVRRR